MPDMKGVAFLTWNFPDEKVRAEREQTPVSDTI
jgi:hypothetical protein